MPRDINCYCESNNLKDCPVHGAEARAQAEADANTVGYTLERRDDGEIVTFTGILATEPLFDGDDDPFETAFDVWDGR
jgi:hypothetical protein